VNSPASPDIDALRAALAAAEARADAAEAKAARAVEPWTKRFSDRGFGVSNVTFDLGRVRSGPGRPDRMDPRARALTDHYLDLLARTGEDFAWPPIEFVPGHEGSEHVEFNEDGSWTTLVTDRGQEYRHRNYTDRHDLMFSLCARATWEAALEQVREPELDARVLEQRTQARQVELMGRIDPEWSGQLERNYRKWRRVRVRMDATDAIEDRLNWKGQIMVYLICALVLGLAVSLVWWTG
jgi:hypothetical protein